MKLRQYETFEEFPDAVLRIDKSSECYWVENCGKKYIAWEKNDVIETLDEKGEKIRYIMGYYNILDGKKIAIIEIITHREKVISKTKNIRVYPLNKVLNIKGNSFYEFTKTNTKEISNLKILTKKR